MVSKAREQSKSVRIVPWPLSWEHSILSTTSRRAVDVLRNFLNPDWTVGRILLHSMYLLIWSLTTFSSIFDRHTSRLIGLSSFTVDGHDVLGIGLNLAVFQSSGNV